MASRSDALAGGADRPVRRPSPNQVDLRPTILRSRPFLAAYVRVLSALLVLAGIVTVVAWDRFRFIMDQPSTRGGLVVDWVPQEVLAERAVPIWEADFGLVEGYLHVLASIATWPPILVPLVLGAVAVVGLSWRRRG